MKDILLVIIIPFLGTVLGSSLVFFMKNKINKSIHKMLLGFSAGVMIAASVWSLIIPALEQGIYVAHIFWLPAVIGLLLGFVFIYIIDLLLNRIDDKTEIHIHNQKNKSLLIFSVTLHNIPEGMAVGVAAAGLFYGNSLLTLSAAMGISLGIAIQNIPEGAIISMPYKLAGTSKIKSFFYGACSGLVEPISALLAFLITGFISQILPYILTFAAGAMLFVSVKEVIPEAAFDDKFNFATLGFALGFILMLILDISLG